MTKVAVLCPICGETRELTRGILYHFPSGIGRCSKCYSKVFANNAERKGIENPSWKGDNVTKTSGGRRARNLFSQLGQCQLCEKPATERHHIDDNTTNNDLSNIMFLCRHHHMEVDGRLEKLIQNGRESSKRLKGRIKICAICGIETTHIWRGRCHACNEYLRRNGTERPILMINSKRMIECPCCGEIKEVNSAHQKICSGCSLAIRREKDTEAHRKARVTKRHTP